MISFTPSYLKLFCIFVFSLCASSYILDEFSVDQSMISVIAPSSSALPTTKFGSVQSTDIIGGERDLILTITGAPKGSNTSTEVSDGNWNLSAPSKTYANFFAQYDGEDNSASLNVTGLGGVDFNELSPVKSFSIAISSESIFSLEILVYDTTGAQSNHLLTHYYPNEQLSEFWVYFSEFIGTANFSIVGAVELKVEVDDAASILISNFFLNTVALSPSPSPSHVRHPSNSPSNSGYSWSPTRSRTPIPPSATRTPSPTKTPFWDGIYTTDESTYVHVTTDLSTYNYFTSFNYSSDKNGSSTTIIFIVTFSVVLGIILLIVGIVFFVFVYPRIKQRAQQSPAPLPVVY